MSVPPKTNAAWADIVSGKKTVTLKFLAAKIMISRLVRNVQGDASKLTAAVDELHALYTKNAATPSAQDDLKTIFG